jgi:hypothetical protein
MLYAPYILIFLDLMSLILLGEELKRKVKLTLCLTNQALRHEGMWGQWIYRSHFLDLGPSWIVSGQLHAPTALPPGIGDWVGSNVVLDDVEKRIFLTLPGLELRPLSRPACSYPSVPFFSLGSNVLLFKFFIWY